MVDAQPRFSTVVLAKEKNKQTNKQKAQLESQHSTVAPGCKTNLHNPVKP